jgi:hypothetical protein
MKPLPLYLEFSALAKNNYGGRIDGLFSGDNRVIAIDAANVRHLWKVPESGEYRDIYPLCLPPWPRCWIEWRSDEAPVACAVTHITRRSVAAWGEMVTEIAPSNLPIIQSADSVVLLIPWVRNSSGKLTAFDALAVVAMDERGVILDVSFKGANSESLRMSPVLYHFPLFTFCLSNCKNISLVEALAYRRRSRGRPKNFYSYKVLATSGSLTATGSGDSATADPIGRRMHICRGHFACYSDERPLFGKFTGLFWKPMHLRGKVNVGIADKDYEVNPHVVGPVACPNLQS